MWYNTGGQHFLWQTVRKRKHYEGFGVLKPFYLCYRRHYRKPNTLYCCHTHIHIFSGFWNICYSKSVSSLWIELIKACSCLIFLLFMGWINSQSFGFGFSFRLQRLLKFLNKWNFSKESVFTVLTLLHNLCNSGMLNISFWAKPWLIAIISLQRSKLITNCGLLVLHRLFKDWPQILNQINIWGLSWPWT